MFVYTYFPAHVDELDLCCISYVGVYVFPALVDTLLHKFTFINTHIHALLAFTYCFRTHA